MESADALFDMKAEAISVHIEIRCTSTSPMGSIEWFENLRRTASEWRHQIAPPSSCAHGHPNANFLLGPDRNVSSSRENYQICNVMEVVSQLSSCQQRSPRSPARADRCWLWHHRRTCGCSPCRTAGSRSRSSRSPARASRRTPAWPSTPPAPACRRSGC